MGNVPLTFSNESMQTRTSFAGFVTEMHLLLLGNVEGDFRDKESLIYEFSYCLPTIARKKVLRPLLYCARNIVQNGNLGKSHIPTFSDVVDSLTRLNSTAVGK